MVAAAPLIAALVTAAMRPEAQFSRRAVLGGAAAACGVAPAHAASLEKSAYAAGDMRPDLDRTFFETILPPVPKRTTVRTAIGPEGADGDGMWGFEQLLCFANVSASIRMTVVRLADGGLWVNAPVAPTEECLTMLNELGTVKHIVLPVTALEHKAFFGPFVRRFPEATRWVSPGQYGPFGSVPLGGGPEKSSLPYRIDGVLGEGAPPPWASEIESKIFYVDLPGNAGPVSETAFYHRPSKTLLVTDAVVFIPPEPTSTLFESAYGDAARDADFWPKSVLQAVFLPLRQSESGSWPGYERIRGRLLRAPILRAFADARSPEETRAWVNGITSGEWPFERIISAHFASPIRSNPKELRSAFGAVYGDGTQLTLDEADWAALDDLNKLIEDNKLGSPLKMSYR